MLTEFVFTKQVGSKTHSVEALTDWSAPPSRDTKGELLAQTRQYGAQMIYISSFMYTRNFCVYLREGLCIPEDSVRLW